MKIILVKRTKKTLCWMVKWITIVHVEFRQNWLPLSKDQKEQDRKKSGLEIASQ
jgi:hypothetical protein